MSPWETKVQGEVKLVFCSLGLSGFRLSIRDLKQSFQTFKIAYICYRSYNPWWRGVCGSFLLHLLTQPPLPPMGSCWTAGLKGEKIKYKPPLFKAGDARKRLCIALHGYPTAAQGSFFHKWVAQQCWESLTSWQYLRDYRQDGATPHPVLCSEGMHLMTLEKESFSICVDFHYGGSPARPC